jgi:hypothetical protein
MRERHERPQLPIRSTEWKCGKPECPVCGDEPIPLYRELWNLLKLCIGR